MSKHEWWEFCYHFNVFIRENYVTIFQIMAHQELPTELFNGSLNK